MFLKLSETFKFFTRLGGKFFGLKSIRLGQFNSERPSSGSGSCRTTLKICTLSKSLCWENWICVCIFPINMFCIMQLPPKRVLGQESAIFCDIQISVHWVYLEASRGQLYSRGSDLLRWGQLYSGGSDWHLSIPSSLFPPCNILYFPSMSANSNFGFFWGWKKTYFGDHNIFWPTWPTYM